MEKSALENGELLGPYFSNWSMERYYTLMDRMNFSPSKQLWQLSKGEYMKMQTCFALAHHPRFLILDEPLEGFDPVFRNIIGTHSTYHNLNSPFSTTLSIRSFSSEMSYGVNSKETFFDSPGCK